MSDETTPGMVLLIDRIESDTIGNSQQRFNTIELRGDFLLPNGESTGKSGILIINKDKLIAELAPELSALLKVSE